MVGTIWGQLRDRALSRSLSFPLAQKPLCALVGIQLYMYSLCALAHTHKHTNTHIGALVIIGSSCEPIGSQYIVNIERSGIEAKSRLLACVPIWGPCTRCTSVQFGEKSQAIGLVTSQAGERGRAIELAWPATSLIRSFVRLLTRSLG